MKRILLGLFCVLLSVFMFTAAGCGKSNEIVEGSLEHTVSTSSSSYDRISGSFQIAVNKGKVVSVEFTVTGFDSNGNKLWSKNIYKSYEGLESQNEPHKIEFSYSHYLEGSSVRTETITVTGIKITKEKANEWIGWTFGAVSAVATAAVITFFVLSKRNEYSDVK